MAADKPHYQGHRERLRQRYRQAGPDALHDYELLELLLAYAIPRQDTKPLAKTLIDHFGSVRAVLTAAPEDLETVAGLGPRTASLVRLVHDLALHCLAERMHQTDTLDRPENIRDFARLRLGTLSNEAFMVVYLTAAHRVLDCQVLHEGTVNHAIVYPRRIVERALACKAAAVILIHNHPSGDLTPSPADLKLTRAVQQAAAPLDITVTDHLIVNPDTHFSFAENGLLYG